VELAQTVSSSKLPIFRCPIDSPKYLIPSTPLSH
jgi:hypothetical protein